MYRFLQKIGALVNGIGSLFTIGKGKPKLPENLQAKVDCQMRSLEDHMKLILSADAQMGEHEAEVRSLMSKIKVSKDDLQLQARSLLLLCEKLDEMGEALSEKAATLD
jgi:hypothetical protein